MEGRSRGREPGYRILWAQTCDDRAIPAACDATHLGHLTASQDPEVTSITPGHLQLATPGDGEMIVSSQLVQWDPSHPQSSDWKEETAEYPKRFVLTSRPSSHCTGTEIEETMGICGIFKKVKWKSTTITIDRHDKRNICMFLDLKCDKSTFPCGQKKKNHATKTCIGQ